FVCGLGGVDGEQNGSSKQMATHDTLREDYVKCYNVTIADNKGVLALVARPNTREARMRLPAVQRSALCGAPMLCTIRMLRPTALHAASSSRKRSNV
ncbi:hypothetical protein J0L38_19330, partial [Stenotrophomonas maltophilia]|nr:hypothetical protein [Stenotrophomonas maltophilia]